MSLSPENVQILLRPLEAVTSSLCTNGIRLKRERFSLVPQVVHRVRINFLECFSTQLNEISSRDIGLNRIVQEIDHYIELLRPQQSHNRKEADGPGGTWECLELLLSVENERLLWVVRELIETRNEILKFL